MALPLVSVIVPAYNAENTVVSSLNSILSQDYPALEVIVANDCSQDRTLALCQELAQKNEQLHVLALPKSGVAGARNAALKAARGELVMFCDSDDTMTPGAVRHMAEGIGACDLMIAHFNFVLGSMSSDRGLLSGERVLSEGDFFTALLDRPGSFYYSALWNKMYRMDLIRQLQLSFDPFLSWGEDFAFNMQYNRAVSSVRVTDMPIYNYVKSLSGTSVRTLSHPLHSLAIKKRLYRHFKGLYLEKGMYAANRFKVHRYIVNVTLED